MVLEFSGPEVTDAAVERCAAWQTLANRVKGTDAYQGALGEAYCRASNLQLEEAIRRASHLQEWLLLTLPQRQLSMQSMVVLMGGL